MNYKLFSVLSFVAGAAIGSVVTWKFVKTKYEQIAQEEIESVKETFSRRREFEEVGKAAADGIAEGLRSEKPDIMEYAARLHHLGYANESDEIEDDSEEDQDEEYYEKEEEDSMRDKPYVISADEFDENGYETETLTYFADGVLTDWYNDPVEDVEGTVGKDALDNFDEYADGDTVFVRNDNYECDYEIQRDHRNYSDLFPEESMED